MPFEKNDIILFQGDSITDCGRNYADASSLGVGYALMAGARLGLQYAEKNLTFLNRESAATGRSICRSAGKGIVLR